MEEINPEKRHLYSAEINLNFLLSKQDFESAIDLCEVDPHLRTHLINYMVLRFFKEPEMSLLRESIVLLLNKLCSSLDNIDGCNKLAIANATLVVGGNLELLPEIHKELIEEFPIDFASLLLKRGDPIRSIDVVNTALKSNEQRMKVRASSQLGELEKLPCYIGTEQFKQVDS